MTTNSTSFGQLDANGTKKPSTNQIGGQRRGGKYVACKVILLDDSELIFQVPPKCTGCILLREVFKKLQVIETDYFDLEYNNEYGFLRWVDPEKPILKQCAHKKEPIFKFVVKFYSPDPGMLEAEYTRYLFALQVKRDLATGAMPCQEHTAVLLASYVVQAEFGDYCVEQCEGQEYLSDVRLLPEQTKDIEAKIMEHHIEHRGQSPAEADFNLLDTARKVELYGLKMHSAKDHDGVALHLAVAHLGILVFQNYTKINTFSWAKIRKISFKRKRFLIKLHPEGYGYYKDTVEFYFDTRDDCKTFWKKCIEHHSFFRCHVTDRRARSTSRHRVISRGSSFRYSGRTQKQLVEYVRDQVDTLHISFERSISMRTVSTSRSAGATPRTGTMSSRKDFSAISQSSCPGVTGPMTASMSSGSHTLLSQKTHRDTDDDDDDDDDDDEADRDVTVDADLSIKSTLSTSRSTDAVLEQYASHTERPSRPLTREVNKQSSPAIIDGSRDEEDSKPILSRSPEFQNIPSELSEKRKKISSLRYKNSRNIPSPPPSPRYDSDEEIDLSRNAVRTPASTEDDCPPPPPPPPIYRDPGEQDTESDMMTPRSVKTASILSGIASSNHADSRDDLHRKKSPNDITYYISKELLMSERTYRKELELLCVLFRNAMNAGAECSTRNLERLLFSNLDPIYNHHIGLLKELEHRMAIWEGKLTSNIVGDHQRISDILVKSLPIIIKSYSAYMMNHADILTEIESLLKRSRPFERIYSEFEQRKHCYLPLHTYLLRPSQRLSHYSLLLEKLMNTYGESSINYADCEACYRCIQDARNQHLNTLMLLENKHKLIELERDLIGIDNIVLPNRTFIREGCLQKLSRRGFQQRMFLLFNDTLLYMSRTASSHLQFKVHGQLPTLNMKMENIDEGTSTYGVPNAFNVISGNKSLKLAASNVEEKDKWIEDLEQAIRLSNDSDLQGNMYSTIKASSINGSTDTLDDALDNDLSNLSSPGGQSTTNCHRGNTTMHVCWHRNTSVSLKDITAAGQNHFSGYVLRKFKNSNGWQKLWVIFTNFCLFFYKTFQDEYPLASLPLLGYAITTPNAADNINKEFVFKLQFKNHVYYFRAESEYTFNRWMKVISSATSTARMVRAFSRFESSTSR